MRKLLWLIPLFFLTPVVVAVLDLYWQFITGGGFLSWPTGSHDVVALRVLTMTLGGFCGALTIPFCIRR